MATNMKWNANTDAKLLVAVIGQLSVLLNLDSIAGRLGCTPRAVQEHVKGLKKLAARQLNAGVLKPSKRGKAAEHRARTKKHKTTTPNGQKSLKNKTAPAKKENKEAIESDEERSFEDRTLTSIPEEDVGEADLADIEDNLEADLA
ncbi:hypothetical protein MMC32_003160 [Xylographa parallela]|nr:hypothetical protein [Xylographa parallela]